MRFASSPPSPPIKSQESPKFLPSALSSQSTILETTASLPQPKKSDYDIPTFANNRISNNHVGLHLSTSEVTNINGVDEADHTPDHVSDVPSDEQSGFEIPTKLLQGKGVISIALKRSLLHHNDGTDSVSDVSPGFDEYYDVGDIGSIGVANSPFSNGLPPKNQHQIHISEFLKERKEVQTSKDRGNMHRGLVGGKRFFDRGPGILQGCDFNVIVTQTTAHESIIHPDDAMPRPNRNRTNRRKLYW